MILGNKRSPNLGGLTYKEILDGTKAAVGSSYPIDYDGKRVIMWLGDAEFLANGRLKCKGVKFYKDGSFTINGIINQKADENWLYIRKNTDFYYSVNVEDDLTVGSDGSGNLTVNGDALVKKVLTTYSHTKLGVDNITNTHEIYGQIYNVLKGVSSPAKGLVPMLLYYGRVNMTKASGSNWYDGNVPVVDYYKASNFAFYAGREDEGVAVLSFTSPKVYGSRTFPYSKGNTIVDCKCIGTATDERGSSFAIVKDRNDEDWKNKVSHFGKLGSYAWDFLIEIYDKDWHDWDFEVKIWQYRN